MQNSADTLQRVSAKPDGSFECRNDVRSFIKSGQLKYQVCLGCSLPLCLPQTIKKTRSLFAELGKLSL